MGKFDFQVGGICTFTSSVWEFNEVMDACMLLTHLTLSSMSNSQHIFKPVLQCFSWECFWHFRSAMFPASPHRPMATMGLLQVLRKIPSPKTLNGKTTTTHLQILKNASLCLHYSAAWAQYVVLTF